MFGVVFGGGGGGAALGGPAGAVQYGGVLQLNEKEGAPCAPNGDMPMHQMRSTPCRGVTGACIVPACKIQTPTGFECG